MLTYPIYKSIYKWLRYQNLQWYPNEILRYPIYKALIATLIWNPMTYDIHPPNPIASTIFSTALPPTHKVPKKAMAMPVLQATLHRLMVQHIQRNKNLWNLVKKTQKTTVKRWQFWSNHHLTLNSLDSKVNNKTQQFQEYPGCSWLVKKEIQ